MAKNVEPTCRYGHGQLIRCQLDKVNPESGIYFVPTEHGLDDMSQGFSVRNLEVPALLLSRAP